MPKNKPPEVIISFESNSNEQEFLEFIETVLSWGKTEEKKSINKSEKYAKNTLQENSTSKLNYQSSF